MQEQTSAIGASSKFTVRFLVFFSIRFLIPPAMTMAEYPPPRSALDTASSSYGVKPASDALRFLLLTVSLSSGSVRVSLRRLTKNPASDFDEGV